MERVPGVLGMNRQQRRKAQRRGTFVDTETGMVAHGLGTAHEVRIKADLPPKVAGGHRWIATAAYVLTEEEARSALPDQPIIVLGPNKMMSFGVGCWDCEREYSECAGRRCPV